MQTGTVKFFNETKGFGFIIDEDSDAEIFVHVTGIVKGPIREGSKVQFEIAEGKKGAQAVDVSLV